MIGDLVARLIAAGTPPEVAAAVVAEAYAAGVTTGVSAAPKDDAAERRREKDRERKRLTRSVPSAEFRGHPQKSADSTDTADTIPPDGPPSPQTPQPPLNPPVSSCDETNSQRANAPKTAEKRATRLTEGWELPEAGWEFARKLGLTTEQIERELLKFQNHFLSKAGPDAAKKDWLRTWQNWALRAVERGSTAPRFPGNPLNSSKNFGSGNGKRHRENHPDPWVAGLAILDGQGGEPDRSSEDGNVLDAFATPAGWSVGGRA